MFTRCLVLLAALCAGALLAAPARVAAAEPISVKVNMARILRIGSPAATVIIGNPGIADVTIQDPLTLVLTGKSYGQTNMIILDSVGNPIADTMIEVVQSGLDTVTIYQGLARTTMSCTPQCQPTIMLGDDPIFTQQSISSSELIQQNASR